MKKSSAALGLLLILVSGCDPADRETKALVTGTWRAAIEIQGHELPFNMEVETDPDRGYVFYIRNAAEKLKLDEITLSGDSVTVGLHIFDATIKAVHSGDSMNGWFIKNYENDYRIPFRAAAGQGFRFEKGEDTAYPDFNGTYRVLFTSKTDTTLAVGVFEQIQDSVTGTFLTPTGDYRYLQGNVANGKLQLSTFDGNHAYLFLATKISNDSLRGKYYSGKTVEEDWIAVRDDNASLPDAASLTYLKPGYERITFEFPDVTGKAIRLDNEKYQNKVVILQLFGSWCPNCMDETRFLSPWYDKNKNRGVEIIGLAYERKDDFTYASQRVKK